jgi:hypothetical protein
MAKNSRSANRRRERRERQLQKQTMPPTGGMPSAGTMERIVLEKLLAQDGVSCTDFAEYGMTDEELARIIENLRTGMYPSDADPFLRQDA